MGMEEAMGGAREGEDTAFRLAERCRVATNPSSPVVHTFAHPAVPGPSDFNV